jgi:hypothetical protein
VLLLGGFLIFSLPVMFLEAIVKTLTSSAPAEAVSLMVVLTIIRVIGGGLLGFYGIVYGVITYQQAKEVTDETQTPNLAWVWIVTLLGWMIAVLLGLQVLKIAKSSLVQDQLKTMTNESSLNNLNKPTEEERVAKWQSDMKPEAKVYYEASRLIFGQMNNNASDRVKVKKLNDSNIVGLKKAVEIDPSNPEIWISLSDAYTWVNSKGTLDDALIASKKAETLDPAIWSYSARTAEIYLMLKKYDLAILKFQEVVRAEDNYARAHIGLGIAYSRNGIKDVAKTELQKGIDILTKYNADGKYDDDILQARKEMGSL